MKKITFYQHHHNGDLFVSKEYVRQIVNDLPDLEFEYFHNNNPKTLLDLGIRQSSFKTNSLPVTEIYVENSNHLFINTWLFVHSAYDRRGNINHTVMNKIFTDVFNKINDFFDVNLKIRDKHDYISSIDYSKFNTDSIDQYVLKNKRKKVLISNGKPMANQSFSDNMSNVVNTLASRYRDTDFICTDRFESRVDNVKFTDDIIPEDDILTKNPNSWNKRRCDLNEISYLSKFCDIIVGKNSGPYIYCMTKDNIYDISKTIIVFNKRSLDSLLAGIDHKAKYIYRKMDHKNYDENIVKQTIEENL